MPKDPRMGFDAGHLLPHETKWIQVQHEVEQAEKARKQVRPHLCIYVKLP